VGPQWRSFWQGRRGGIVVDVVLVAALLSLGASVAVPRLRTSHDPAGAPPTAVARIPAQVGVPAGLRAATDDTTYQTGDCYTWAQAAPTQDDVPSSSATQDVACAQPHLVQAVGAALIPDDQYPGGSDYPSPAAWSALADTYCGSLTTAFLGYPLDPHGLFGLAIITPGADHWDEGDRQVTCGLRHTDLAALPGPGAFTAFTGDIRGADQSLVYPTGACLAEDPTGTVLGTVTCADPYQAVAVGSITMPGWPSAMAPPTATQFDDLAAPRCELLARAFLGAAFHDSPAAHTSWLRIAPDSWGAGSRSFTCTVSFTTATGAPRAVTGSPLAAATAV
jgi:hypothetical protein